MKDSQILSAFQEPQPAPAGAESPPLAFDTCNAGVVLRTVVFVEAAVAVVAMFGAAGLVDWIARAALLSGGALPGALIWLVAACLLKTLLSRLSTRGQYTAGIALGALAGMYGCAVLAIGGFLSEPVASTPWLASACAGALAATVLVATLVLRHKGRAPAATAARLSQLQSRIQPHFLFNTLNSAIALVREEPAKAEALLEDLSDLFRHALAEPGDAVTLAEEITLARRYLAIEQVRFGERLRVEWDLDPAADDARLPPLVLQPLVENAVKHGVEPSPTGAQIKISTERRDTTVVVRVTNTVPAGQGRAGNGVALENVRDRLYLLHDVQGQFQTALKNGVYQARMQFPA